MTTSTWETIDESPAVLAVRTALDNNTFIPNPNDVRMYVTGATMPIENLRQQLLKHQMPSGQFLGPTFERRVFTNRWFYFGNRNRRSGLLQFSRDAQFEFELLDWTAAQDGQYVGMNLCVTPSPLVDPTTDWLTFVQEWCEWLFPYFEGALQVVICNNASLDFDVQIGAAAVVTQMVVAR